MNDQLAIASSVPFDSLAKPHKTFGLITLGGILRPDGRIFEARVTNPDGSEEVFRWNDGKKEFQSLRSRRWKSKEAIVRDIENGAYLRGIPLT